MSNTELIKTVNADHQKKVLLRRMATAIDCSHPKLTDQSYKGSSDINNIMKRYKKTGILPETKKHLAKYVDNSNIPSIEDAHNVIMEAKNLFMQLPAEVRKKMGNDPANMVDFVKDEKNKDYLVEKGLLEIVQDEVVQVQVINSPKPEDEPKGE